MGPPYFFTMIREKPCSAALVITAIMPGSDDDPVPFEVREEDDDEADEPDRDAGGL